mmetsp:Transcript_22959/g.52057  ORF Transcript_22959/g.52057 Transcript_22959/m.52057 type:complete len:93 (+) Transcript_22959:396-674(+)
MSGSAILIEQLRLLPRPEGEPAPYKTLERRSRATWSSPLEKRALSDTVLVLFTAMAAAVSSPERDSKTNPTVARSRPPPYHSRLMEVMEANS